jgi:hypothetical protein
VTTKVTQNTGHALEPDEDWSAEGKGVTEASLYTFPEGPSKYPGLAPTYRKSAAAHADLATAAGSELRSQAA